MTAKLEKRIEIEPVLLGDVIRNVPLYTEDQTYWDWAACIKMAVEYYTGNRDIRQCEIVNAYTTRTDCCGRPRSQHCNFGLKENDVAQAFRSQGIRALKHPGQGGVALSELSRLLADNQIPLISLEWTYMTNKKTYQLALVRGAGDTYVTVNDPFRGQKYVTYDSLLAGYGEPGGTWLSTWALSR